MLGLVTGDGHERERAVRAAPMTPLTARLLTLRCIDWAGPIRDAALARLDHCPHDLLVRTLPLAEQLASERARGKLLDAFLDARLSDSDLRRAYVAQDAPTRRAAWRRLSARGVLTADELCEIAAQDEDGLVRTLAADVVAGLPADDQRALAQVLVGDPLGRVAVPALAALVQLDGVDAIGPALLAPAAAVRRAARDWASIKGVDARAVYIERLTALPRDAIALVAVTELADPRDAGRFRRMLDDPRSRVRSAGLRGLARVDPAAGRSAAIRALDRGATGRVTWAAVAVCDAAIRAHLDTEVCAWVASSRRISRGPSREVRARIEALLPALDPSPRGEIEFVLRTSALRLR